MTEAGGAKRKGGWRGGRSGGGRGSSGDRPGSGGRADHKRRRYQHSAGITPGGPDAGFRVGARGFLVSCVTGKEAPAGREAVGLVEEVWEGLMTARAAAAAGDDPPGAAAAAPAAPPPADLGGALEADLASLREGRGQGGGGGGGGGAPFSPTFKWHGLGVGCLVFVSMARPPKPGPPLPPLPAAAGGGPGPGPEGAGGDKEGEGAAPAPGEPPPPPPAPATPALPGPVDIALALATSILASGQGRARHVLRLLPVEAVVPATLASLTSAVSGLARRHLPGAAEGGAAGGGGGGGDGDTKHEEKKAAAAAATYAVQYEHRSSSSLDRMAVINALVDGIPPGHAVNLGSPDVTVLASAVRGQVSLGVVPGYAALHKLNLRELACPSPGAAKAREEREARRLKGGGEGEAGGGAKE